MTPAGVGCSDWDPARAVWDDEERESLAPSPAQHDAQAGRACSTSLLVHDQQEDRVWLVIF